MFGTKQKTVDTSNLAIASSIGLADVSDGALSQVSAGARDTGFSNKGFSRNRMQGSRESVVGPNGVWTKETIQTEEIDSFAQEGWDVIQ